MNQDICECIDRLCRTRQSHGRVDRQQCSRELKLENFNHGDVISVLLARITTVRAGWRMAQFSHRYE
jgi:hypothetical protein